MTVSELSDNHIELLTRLEKGELDEYDFKCLPNELQHAFHELWSVNSKLGHDHVEIEHCAGCKCGHCDGAFYSINNNGLAALGKPAITDDNDKPLANWIHPDLLKSVKEWCPDNVKEINPYTYEIFDVVFVVTGNNISVGSMMVFLMDNGWEHKGEDDDDS